MKPKLWKFVVITILVAGLFSAYLAFGLNFGLDLRGGTELRYGLDLRGIPEEQRSPEKITLPTIAVLQKRVDSLGLKEIPVRQAGDFQIRIELPGISEQSKEQIKNVIKKAGKLWFKIVADTQDPTLIDEIWKRKQLGDYLDDPAEEPYDVALDGKQVAVALRSGERIDGDLVREDENVYVVKVRGERKQDFTLKEAAKKDVVSFERRKLLLTNEDAVSGTFLEGADYTKDEFFAPAVAFNMRQPSGAERMAATTQKNIRKQMAIVLDDVIISAPVIQSQIRESGRITGDFTIEEVQELVTVLRSGALKAKPFLQSEQTISAALGQESVTRGTYAVIGAIALVIVFMFVYYFGAGVVASLALLFNLAMTLGILALFDATLTLPGIAGLVLTMGMSVDANILIYERIREEKRRGVPITESIQMGYGRAFWAIFDSNITTILTAIVLYYVGTGPIRGFAVTLIAGIATSMFTAIFVTRAIFELLVGYGIVTDVKMLELIKQPNFPFVRKRMPFVVAGLILLNLGFASFAVRGPDKYGIDFNGGSIVEMRLKEKLPKEEIERRLGSVEKTLPATGEKVRPYTAAEVLEVGDEGTHYQIVVSAADTAFLKTEILSGPAAVPGDAALPERAPGEDDEEGAAVVAPETPQEIFLRDVHELFRKELVPDSFEPVQALPAESGKVTESRLRLIANLETAKLPQGKDATAEVRKPLEEFGYVGAEIVVRPGGGAGLTQLVVTTRDLDVGRVSIETHEMQLKRAVEKAFADASSNPFPLKTTIGPNVAENLKARALMSIVLSLLVMIGYIAFRFEFKNGVAASLCLFHDVLATLGFMMFLDVVVPGIDAKINLPTIAAFLTIVGYSINDTIVTFDRIREISHDRKHTGESFADICNLAVNQTLSRTILTSMTVLLTVTILALANVKSIQSFTLAMLFGLFAGTFSTMFIAVPILLTKPARLAGIVLLELAFFLALGLRELIFGLGNWSGAAIIARLAFLAAAAGAAYFLKQSMAEGEASPPSKREEKSQPAAAPAS